MSASFRPSGVLVPLVTPFDEAGAVDFPALGRLAARALDAGAAGVVALATTGEPTSLDDGLRTTIEWYRDRLTRECPNADGRGSVKPA